MCIRDRIIPLSDLLGVTANELLSGKADIAENENIDNGEQSENNEAENVKSEIADDKAALSASVDKEDENKSHINKEQSAESMESIEFSANKNVEEMCIRDRFQ